MMQIHTEFCSETVKGQNINLVSFMKPSCAIPEEIDDGSIKWDGVKPKAKDVF